MNSTGGGRGASGPEHSKETLKGLAFAERVGKGDLYVCFGQCKTELVDELHDPFLAEIAEIVHDAHLMDEKYGRAPSPRAWTRSCAGCRSHSPTTTR